jgi:tellurite resistance protein
MVQIKGWIKKAVQSVVDPDKEERIAEISAHLERALAVDRQKFSISDFTNSTDYGQRDLDLAKRATYRKFINRAWADGKVTKSEISTLTWIATVLSIPRLEAESLQIEFAEEHLLHAFSDAMEDGILDDKEAQRLGENASSVGLTLPPFAHSYFHTEGERFLRGIFSACTNGGSLPDNVWARLVSTTERLGFSLAELQATIQSQAQLFVEHVVADAKSDGLLSETEEAFLTDLINKLGLSKEFCDYVFGHIHSLRTIRLAGKGKLPSIAPPFGIAIRAGEIVHFHALAKWYQRRILKTGDRWDVHVGTVTITDNRLFFSSDTKSFDVRFGRIVSFHGKTGEITLQRIEKPESTIRINETEPVAYAILDGAIGLSNQTRVANPRFDPVTTHPARSSSACVATIWRSLRGMRRVGLLSVRSYCAGRSWWKQFGRKCATALPEV